MDRRPRPRPAWAQLPGHLRDRIEQVLGSPVVSAESRQGGWSPGSADRLVLADGRRAFAKAADTTVNTHTVALHRREAEVLHLLAGSGSAPALLGAVESGTWFALVTEDVGGRHPEPAVTAQVVAVLDAVARLPRPGVAARALLGTVPGALDTDAAGWHRLIDDGALGTVPIDTASAEQLRTLAGRHRGALAGDRLVHLDLRFDNTLLDDSGRGHLVDWPSASIGAGWIDAVTIVLEVRRLVGPREAEALLCHPVFDGVPAEHLDVFLAVLGAYFFDAARMPPSPGVEAVRAFQRLQGGVVLAWLRERRPAAFAQGGSGY